MDQHLIMLQKHWTKLAGVDSLMTVAETREKTLASGRAKLTVARESGDSDKQPGDGAKPALGGVFAKRGAIVEAVDPGDAEIDPDNA